MSEPDDWLVIIGGYAGPTPRAVMFNDFNYAKQWAGDRRKQYGCAADVVSMNGMDQVISERKQQEESRG